MTDAATATLNGRSVEPFAVTARRTAQSIRNLYRRAGRDGFPAAVQVGPNRVGFFTDEIDAYLAACPRKTYAEDSADIA